MHEDVWCYIIVKENKGTNNNEQGNNFFNERERERTCIIIDNYLYYY